MRSIFLLLFALTPLWAAGKCGFVELAEGRLKNALTQGSARVELSALACSADQYYDEVLVDTSTHFRVFYTLTGPHATPSIAYVDTLLFWLEKAWEMHTVTLGMEAPAGPSVSYHYRDGRFASKYPVEIIDLAMVRGGSCEGCYGLTLPDASDSRLSTLLIENDFLYGSSWSLSLDWNGCPYHEPTTAITSSIRGESVDYSVHWNWALRVTAFHELYHASQLRYQDYIDHYHFWFESSAVGVEELGAPELDDYLQYLPTAFGSPRNSLLDSTVGTLAVYSQATLHHYFRNRFGLKFDAQIWERLHDDPQRGIAYVMEDAIVAQGVAGGFPLLYADYVQSLLPSGARYADAGSSLLWNPDMVYWPSLKLLPYATLADLPSEPFSYGLYSLQSLENWIPDSSSQLTKRVVSLEDSSYVLVTAGFAPKNSGGTTVTQSGAYPNPWRGQGNLVFVVKSGSKIEILDGAGLRIRRLAVDPTTRKAVWPSADLQSMAPGVYFWRGQDEKMLHRILLIR